MGRKKPGKKMRGQKKIQQKRGSPDGKEPSPPPLSSSSPIPPTPIPLPFPLPLPPPPFPLPSPFPLPPPPLPSTFPYPTKPEQELQPDAASQKEVIDRLGDLMLSDSSNSSENEPDEKAATTRPTESAARYSPLGSCSPTLLKDLEISDSDDDGATIGGDSTKPEGLNNVRKTSGPANQGLNQDFNNVRETSGHPIGDSEDLSELGAVGGQEIPEGFGYIELREYESGGVEEVSELAAIGVDAELPVGGTLLGLEGAVGGIAEAPVLEGAVGGVEADQVDETNPRREEDNLVGFFKPDGPVVITEYDEWYGWDETMGQPAIAHLGDRVIAYPAIMRNVPQRDFSRGLPRIEMQQMFKDETPPVPPDNKLYPGNALIVRVVESVYFMPMYPSAEAASRFNKQLAAARVIVGMPIPPGAQLPDFFMKIHQCDKCDYKTLSSAMMFEHVGKEHPRTRRQKKNSRRKLNDTRL